MRKLVILDYLTFGRNSRGYVSAPTVRSPDTSVPSYHDSLICRRRSRNRRLGAWKTPWPLRPKLGRELNRKEGNPLPLPP